MPHTSQPRVPPPTLTPTTPTTPASPDTTQPQQQTPLVAVPLAVWPTPSTAPVRSSDLASDAGPARVWLVPPLLAQHLIAVYTAPGGTVLAVGGSARILARIAVRLDRRPPTRGRDRRAAAGSVDLLVLTPPALAPPLGTTGAAGTAGAVGSGAGGEGWRRWPHLLGPTGILAVVLPPTRAPGDPAAIVAAAVGAGLTYLQHAIAVLWPLHEDHLDQPHPDGVEPDGVEPDGVEPGPVEPGRGELPAAHADVLLFTRSPEPEDAPEPGTDTDVRPDGRPALDLSHEGATR